MNEVVELNKFEIKFNLNLLEFFFAFVFAKIKKIVHTVKKQSYTTFICDPVISPQIWVKGITLRMWIKRNMFPLNGNDGKIKRLFFVTENFP